MAEKRVYFFGSGKAEGNATMKEILGGKGANLAEIDQPGNSRTSRFYHYDEDL